MSEEDIRREATRAVEILAKTPDELRPPDFSDEALALLYARVHEAQLRYVAPWGQWFEWDGTRWRLEKTLHPLDLARAICRDASAEAKGDGKARVAVVIASRKTAAAVEGLARADRRLAATTDQWDSDPWLLNTPEATIDLRSGRKYPHRQLDFITKVTAVSAGGDCPTWLSFIARVTGNDAELQAFLQRVAGYCLTGSTREHALFFLYGTGANGKSVFVKALVGALGDYAITASMETFAASHNDRHPTELARLRGARLVSAIETEEGRRWAEARIKALTGGDRIAARFMRQDHFEFTPEFKLIIAGNHKPGLRGIDEGIRRRMNLVPFTVTIPPDERDETLSDRLREEWPGILAWAIEGCAEWGGEGLRQPEIVRDATERYLADEDALGQWLEESCLTKVGFYETTSDLYRSWRSWAEKAGEFVGSKKRFVQQLQDRGYAPKRQSNTGNRGFDGIRLKVEDAPASPPDAGG